MLPKFTKRDTPEADPISAVQLNWRNWGEVDRLFDSVGTPANPACIVETYSETCGEGSPEDPSYLEITLNGVVVQHGDWIVLGETAVPMKPADFAAAYEAVPVPDQPNLMM